MLNKTLKTPPFPKVYANPLTPDAALQAALDKAIGAGPGKSWRVPVAIVSLNPDGSRPLAHFKGNELHFSASLLKVGAMYAAFELRAVLQHIAAELGAEVSTADLLAAAAAYLNPKILAKAATLPGLKGVQPAHALPQYAAAFEMAPHVQGAASTVRFTSALVGHLEKMIAISDNRSAAQCVHASGYGYLNGALTDAGLFDPKTEKGIWLAGDYIQGYPYFRIKSANDGMVAQAATSIQLAHLYALIHDGQLVNAGSSTEMLALLAKAVAVPEVFIDRAANLNFKVTHTKVGLGPLKSENGGASVYSECSILEHVSGRKFIAAWQNFVFKDQGFDPIAHVVRDTLDLFLKGK